MDNSVSDWQAKIDRFLAEDLSEALAAVEYDVPSADRSTALALLRRAKIECRHAEGASDAFYQVAAFEDDLTMSVQLNVWRFVVVYSLPETPELDINTMTARFERWQAAATHAGWQLGWRRSVEPEHDSRRIVQIYCSAIAQRNLLDDAREQLYWRNDIVQMTRTLMLEARHEVVRLSLAPLA